MNIFIILALIGTIGTISILILINIKQKNSNNCKNLCHDLFKDSTGVSYETACNINCNKGINLNKQKQCEWCANSQAPMSGFNRACQKYINLNQDKKPNNIFKSECCGKGNFSTFKSLCN